MHLNRWFIAPLSRGSTARGHSIYGIAVAQYETDYAIGASVFKTVRCVSVRGGSVVALDRS
jgi:hypothetical protein